MKLRNKRLKRIRTFLTYKRKLGEHRLGEHIYWTMIRTQNNIVIIVKTKKYSEFNITTVQYFTV